MTSPNVMVVSQTLDVQQAFACVLAESGIALILASTGSEAEEILKHHPISLIFCSDEIPNSGIDHLIREIKQVTNKVPVVAVSRRSNWDYCLRLLHHGALDVVFYPLNQFEIERVVGNALSILELKNAEQAPAASAA